MSLNSTLKHSDNGTSHAVCIFTTIEKKKFKRPEVLSHRGFLQMSFICILIPHTEISRLHNGTVTSAKYALVQVQNDVAV